MPADRVAIEKLMKRCQIGVGGRNALDTAHDIMAECYGTLGALLDEVERFRAENERLRALLRMCDAIAREHGGCDLWDAIDNDGVLYQSRALADALKEPNAKHQRTPE